MGSPVSLLFAPQLHDDAPPITWRVPEFMGTIVPSENLRMDHLIPTTAQFTLFAVGGGTEDDDAVRERTVVIRVATLPVADGTQLAPPDAPEQPFQTEVVLLLGLSGSSGVSLSASWVS